MPGCSRSAATIRADPHYGRGVRGDRDHQRRAIRVRPPVWKVMFADPDHVPANSGLRGVGPPQDAQSSSTKMRLRGHFIFGLPRSGREVIAPLVRVARRRGFSIRVEGARRVLSSGGSRNCRPDSVFWVVLATKPRRLGPLPKEAFASTESEGQKSRRCLDPPAVGTISGRPEHRQRSCNRRAGARSAALAVASSTWPRVRVSISLSGQPLRIPRGTDEKLRPT